VKQLPVPLTHPTRLRSIGYVIAKPDQAVFTRIEGCTNPRHDKFEAAVFDATAWSEEYNKSRNDMANAVMGPESERTEGPPNRQTGKPPAGGTFYERSLPSKSNNSRGERCYTHAMNNDIGVWTAAPSRNLRADDNFPAKEKLAHEVAMVRSSHSEPPLDLNVAS
jgi:hypothetical protein